MKLFSALLTAALTMGANPAAAIPVSYDTPEAEALGELCEAGNYAACDQLVELTGGKCAGPVWSRCGYNSRTMRAVDGGLMVWTPGYGHSRVETVTMCLEDAGVARYQDLITDTHFETFEGCLSSNT
jgi:hypothetical protein